MFPKLNQASSISLCFWKRAQRAFSVCFSVLSWFSKSISSGSAGDKLIFLETLKSFRCFTFINENDSVVDVDTIQLLEGRCANDFTSIEKNYYVTTDDPILSTNCKVEKFLREHHDTIAYYGVYFLQSVAIVLFIQLCFTCYSEVFLSLSISFAVQRHEDRSRQRPDRAESQREQFHSGEQASSLHRFHWKSPIPGSLALAARRNRWGEWLEGGEGDAERLASAGSESKRWSWERNAVEVGRKRRYRSHLLAQTLFGKGRQGGKEVRDRAFATRSMAQRKSL